MFTLQNRLIDKAKHLNFRVRNGAIILFFASIYFWVLVAKPTASSMPSCVIKKISGIPCPGCGGTRSTYYLLHGDISTAASYNISYILLNIFIVIYCTLLLVDIVRKKDHYYNIVYRRLPIWVVVVAVVITLLQWAINIYIGI